MASDIGSGQCRESMACSTKSQAHRNTHTHARTQGKRNETKHMHTHTSDEAKLCFECDGLEASSLSNLTGLWLRFRNETQLIYHATF